MTEASELSVRETTLRDQAAAALRSAILDGEFPPGRRLTERELIERLNVSRTTVRDVLGDLRATGLVTLIPQRGAFVTLIGRAEAEDLYEIRHRVETLVVERFVIRATGDDLLRFDAAIDALVGAADTGAPASQLLELRDAIFAALLAGAASPALAQVTEGVRARVDVLRASSIADATRLRESLQEWCELADAVHERDVTRAVAIYGAHLHKAAEIALTRLPTDDAP
jgi:DNA-binding GntR family transcriptional regulator